MRRPAIQATPAPTRASTRTVDRSHFPVWLIAVLLALVTLALFWSAASHDFISYDDGVYVTENTHVTSGLSLENALWAFGSGYACNWHPITWLSHMLDCQMFGLDRKSTRL